MTGAEEGGTTRPNRLAEEASVGYDVKHTDATYLVSSQGTITDVLQGPSSADASALLAAVHRLLG